VSGKEFISDKQWQYL